MKILHICNHFYPNVGGIETYVRELSRNLIKHGHTSDVLCLDTSYEGKRLSKEEIIDGIKIMRTPCLNFKLYKFAPQILKYTKDYDILHVHGVGFFSDFMSLTKFLHKKPLVLSTHGGIFHTKRIMFMKRFYFYKWSKSTLKNFDLVFAHSSNDKELFEKVATKEKVLLVPYSIYFNDYQKPRKIKRNSLLFVGRLDKNKRIDRLIRVLGLVSKKVKNIELILVGGYIHDHKELIALSKKLGVEKNIVSVGPKYGKDLIKFYSNAHMFVSAAEYEGFGISALEAMAAGCIVVVNNIKAFNNFVKNKKNGYVIDFGDEKSAAELITKVLRSNTTYISKNAKKSAKAYDWSIGIKSALNGYSKLI